MGRPDFLESYKFNWEVFDVMASGRSAIDANNFLANFREVDDAYGFLMGYGYDVSDPIQNAELFGNFQEAIQFIKKFFLKEGNEDGIMESVPSVFYSITDISDLLLIATGNLDKKVGKEESIWAGIILKVMHTILHLDKDLRHRFYSTIQTQIFDRFYKYISRENDKLFIACDEKKTVIPLVEFDIKSTKTRESTIIKLLHKKENVAEELFDRIGIRFITESKIDCLRLMKFLYQNHIVMPNNIKPSRSQNSLLDLDTFQSKYTAILKRAIKENLSEEKLSSVLEELATESSISGISNVEKENEHSSNEYHAIHFTGRQLIKYKNPFLSAFSEIRSLAKNEEGESDLAKKLLSLDTSSIAKDVRFFYPFEVQITDIASHKKNSEGEASHTEYKKSQLESAMKRLFKPLIDYKGLKL